VSPSCSLFGLCGGCHFQHIPYNEQIKFKQEIILSIFERLLDPKGCIREIIPSYRSLGYRARARLFIKQSKSEKKLAIGFYREGTRRIEPVESCPVLVDELNSFLKRLRNGIHAFEGSYSNISNIKGIVIECDLKNNLFATFLLKRAEGEKSLFWDRFCRSLAVHSSSNGKRVHLFWQTSKICFFKEKDLAPKGLFCHPSTFFQGNIQQNRILVEEVVSLVEKGGATEVVEFFCGSGNFSIPLARLGLTVTGIELDKQAIFQAKENAILNDCAKKNTFLQMNLFDKRLELSRFKQCETVLLDPPRTGAKELCTQIDTLMPRSIVYVSCDPMTLARDVVILKEKGYRLKLLQPIDMFPQTFHIETIAVLEIM